MSSAFQNPRSFAQLSTCVVQRAVIQLSVRSQPENTLGK